MKRALRLGFALPSIMIASIVMLIVLVAALSAVSATRTALTDQYYNQLAKEAAESGVQFLLSCLKSNETPTFGVDYRPNSASCTDSTQTSTKMKSVVASSRMESTFAVRITGVEGDYYLLTAKGTVDLLRQSNGMVWSSKEHSLKVNVHKAFLSITDFAVVTRGYNMFVVRPDGSLWAWGRNTYGAIGSGAATATVTTPTKIISSGVVKVATNSSSTYAVKSDGSLWAWGANSSGLVGNNSTTDQTTPVRIVTSGVKELYGSPSAAVMYLIKTDGSLWAWGTASRKAIGNGSSSGLQLTPVRVIASGVRQVAVSYLFDDVSVLMSDGTVRRWGYYYGVTPSVVTGLSGVSRLIGTSQSTYAITAGGALYAWGQNSNGTIGNGVAGSRVDAPYRVFSSGVVDVNTSRSQPGTIALRSDGGLWGWGQNNYCQQADGTTVNRYSPVQVMTNIASMYTYSDGSYGAGAAAPRFAAVTRDGSLYAWGSNMLGAVGNGVNEGALSGGTSQCTPHKVMDSVLLVADSDYYTTYIVTADFNVWSFGANNYSQLGRTGANSLPGQVSLPTIPPLYY
jgi:alpha-tubulin suppressor-like RCC1 family protein